MDGEIGIERGHDGSPNLLITLTGNLNFHGSQTYDTGTGRHWKTTCRGKHAGFISF